MGRWPGTLWKEAGLQVRLTQLASGWGGVAVQ